MRTVSFKSTPENFRKEYLGLKNNTVRKFKDGEWDIRRDILDAFRIQEYNLLDIEIINSANNERFSRHVTDVTYWEGMYIITWEHQL